MDDNHAIENGKGWYSEITELIVRLGTADGDDDTVCEEIQQGPLSVLVRSGWRSPGSEQDDSDEEYEILLSTGGPALRIFGRLDRYSQPASAELQWQDWGTQWTRCTFAAEAPLLTYAQQFWYGE